MSSLPHGKIGIYKKLSMTYQPKQGGSKRTMSGSNLIPELIPLVGDKKSVKIADIGSGPVSKIGDHLDGVEVAVFPSDRREFDGIDQENMENLTYEGNTFDIVHCENALDHTPNALSAVKEMMRVCKPEGFVFIKCWLDQKDTGYKHYWNAKEDGIFTNGTDSFNLKDFGFKIDYTDTGGERRYSYIVAILEKPDA